MPRFAPAILAALLLTSPLLAQETAETAPLPEMSEIEAAWAREDYETVRAGLERLAKEEGSPLAQYRYGRVLVEGRGGPRDLDEAVLWLDKAVAQNHTGAALLLAQIYLAEHDADTTSSLTRDPARAATLLQSAATRGLAEAQLLLAQLYLAGQGVTQSDTAGFNWTLAAAEQGDVDAQMVLVRLYSRGIGTEASDASALHWLTKAAENGHPRAQFSLARAYETGTGVPQSPARAADWYRSAAESGMALAQRQLGMAYLTGQGAPQDSAEALVWLNRAAKGQDSGAMYNLGQIYAKGEVVPQDDAQALQWFTRAGEYGLGRAQVALGAMYEAGRGTEADLEAALEQYLRALDTSDATRAARRLGQLAADGQLDGRYAPARMAAWVQVPLQEGEAAAEAWMAAQAAAGLRQAQIALAGHLMALPERTEDGVRYLRQAARAGAPDAQLRLGRMLMTGDLVDLDYVTAYGWLNIAATLGAAEAVELRETAKALMTPDQIEEAQAFTRHWFDEVEPQPPATEQTVRDVTIDKTTREEATE